MYALPQVGSEMRKRAKLPTAGQRNVVKRTPNTTQPQSLAGIEGRRAHAPAPAPALGSASSDPGSPPAEAAADATSYLSITALVEPISSIGRSPLSSLRPAVPAARDPQIWARLLAPAMRSRKTEAVPKRTRLISQVVSPAP